MKKLLLIILIFLNGCAVLADRRVMAGCQVADGLTTYYALKHGAVEANPLLSGLSPGAILFMKVAFAYVIWQVFREPPKSTAEAVGRSVVSSLGCVPAISNIGVINKLP